MIISDQDHQAPTVTDALRFFAALNATDPPDGVSLPDWLAAVTAARAVLRDPSPERGDAGAEAMRERIIALIEVHTYRGQGTEGRNDLIGMFARGQMRCKQTLIKKIAALATPAQEQVQGEESGA